jgi:hypothetical protein
LEAEKQSEENGDLIIEAVEWCFIVFVFSVQGPDVGCDEIDVIL